MQWADYKQVAFFFQAEDGIRDYKVTGVQTCALPICRAPSGRLEPDAQLVATAPRMPAVMDELPVHHGVGPQRIPALQQAARAVDTGLAVVLGLEGAEQAVPDDEDAAVVPVQVAVIDGVRSEEHTSELQSPCNLVCRLLLEKKKINKRLA